MLKHLLKADPKLARLIKDEIKRQQETLDLIPSENIASQAVMEALGSPLTNKYSEGYPGKRYYAGNKIIDEIELLAQQRAKIAFGLKENWSVNVQPYSGSPANLAVYSALLDPGDVFMGMSLTFGGHLTHGWKVSATGKFWRTVHYGVDEDGWLDYKEIESLAQKHKPKLIVCGATAYSRVIDFQRFARIAHSIGAYLMADISHIAGLVSAGLHPSPFGWADVVTTTTHKTLRGPRGALIFVDKNSKVAYKNKIDIEALINKAVFPGLQGGPHNNQIAAIAAALYEVSKPSFKRYSRQVVRNAQALSDELVSLGARVITGGTDNHLMLVDVANCFGITGRDAQVSLEKAGIIVNCNTIPYDTRPPFNPSGIRLGTPAVTSRGMKEKEMRLIAKLISEVLKEKGNTFKVYQKVKALCKKFTI